MNNSLYLAVDLGAGSGRVFLAGAASGELLLEEVRRFCYPASRSAGQLRWNLPYIFDEIKAGAREAGERARKRHVAENVRLKKFTPRRSLYWEEAGRRYAAIESRDVN